MTEIQGNTLQNYFTIEQLRSQIKNISREGIIEQSPIAVPRAYCQFAQHIQKYSSDCMQSLETAQHIIYVLAKNKQTNSIINIFIFEKEDGRNKVQELAQFANSVTCMKFIQCKYTSSGEMQDENKQKKSKYKLVIALRDGSIHILDMSERLSHRNLRIDAKPITMLISGNYQTFGNHNICLALTVDSTIFLVDISEVEVVYVLKPMIAMCDKALSLQINCQKTYLMQTTDGGYIILWKLEQIINHCRQLNHKKQSKLNKKEYSVFPSVVNHSIAIQGLIWGSFYGHLFIMITKSGKLKIVALDVFEVDEWIGLLQHPLQNVQNISHVCLFASRDFMLLGRNQNMHSFIEKITIGSNLTVSHILKFNIDNIDFLNNFYLTKDMEILMCRGNKMFAIGQSPKEIINKNKKRKQVPPAVILNDY